MNQAVSDIRRQARTNRQKSAAAQIDRAKLEPNCDRVDHAGWRRPVPKSEPFGVPGYANPRRPARRDGCSAAASVVSRLPTKTEVKIVFICSSTPSRRRIRGNLLTARRENLQRRGRRYNMAPIRSRRPMPGELDTNDISKLLRAWSDGDQSALDGLTPIVYNELRRLAHRYMERERPGHTLQTTALVNEAYMRAGRRRAPRVSTLPSGRPAPSAPSPGRPATTRDCRCTSGSSAPSRLRTGSPSAIRA